MASEKVMTSLRMDRNWIKQIKLKYGSLASWAKKNCIREFGDNDLAEAVQDLVKSGELTKVQLQEIIKKA